MIVANWKSFNRDICKMCFSVQKQGLGTLSSLLFLFRRWCPVCLVLFAAETLVVISFHLEQLREVSFAVELTVVGCIILHTAVFKRMKAI